jgi:hypothetical protein
VRIISGYNISQLGKGGSRKMLLFYFVLVLMLILCTISSALMMSPGGSSASTSAAISVALGVLLLGPICILLLTKPSKTTSMKNSFLEAHQVTPPCNPTMYPLINPTFLDAHQARLKRKLRRSERSRSGSMDPLAAYYREGGVYVNRFPAHRPPTARLTARLTSLGHSMFRLIGTPCTTGHLGRLSIS